METSSPDPLNFNKAVKAFNVGDFKSFNEALTNEMTIDPTNARDIAETCILGLANKAYGRRSPAMRILTKAVDTLTTLAPVISFNDWERTLTLRALNVAAAVCSYSSAPELANKAAASVRQLEKTPYQRAYCTALEAGVINWRGEITGKPIKAYALSAS